MSLHRINFGLQLHAVITGVWYDALEASDADRKALKRWPGLKTLAMVFRQRTIGVKEQTEVAYFISSHEPKVRAFRSAFAATGRLKTAGITCSRSLLQRKPAASAKERPRQFPRRCAAWR